jgi:hypothetical protein
MYLPILAKRSVTYSHHYDDRNSFIIQATGLSLHEYDHSFTIQATNGLRLLHNGAGAEPVSCRTKMF